MANSTNAKDIRHKPIPFACALCCGLSQVELSGRVRAMRVGPGMGEGPGASAEVKGARLLELVSVGCCAVFGSLVPLVLVANS